MKKFFCIALFALSQLLVDQSLLAHQQKEAYTNILLNSRSGMLEISHRFYLHDAEHALQIATGENADMVANRASQQRFADYLVSHFSLKISHQPAALNMVGFETEGKYFWVYQEMNMLAVPTSLEVKMTALQEVWRSHVNHVNVQHDKRVASARLKAGDDFAEIKVGRENQ